LEKLPQLKEILNSDSGEKDGVENVEVSDKKESDNQQDIIETPTPPSFPSNSDKVDDSTTGDSQNDPSLMEGTSDKD